MDSEALRLVICIVNHGYGEPVVAATKRAGAQGGTILLGRGTATGKWMELLGLGDTRKEITYTIVPETLTKAILDELRADTALKKALGISVVIPLNQLIRHATIHTANAMGETMETTHEMISVIVNYGYADDIMAAARKAGAQGGTIINARGTGKEEDAKFFGFTLVPEKELLVIIAKKENSTAILDAIRQTPCLKQPGMGIAFCSPVTDFISIGGKKA